MNFIPRKEAPEMSENTDARRSRMDGHHVLQRAPFHKSESLMHTFMSNTPQNYHSLGWKG